MRNVLLAVLSVARYLSVRSVVPATLMTPRTRVSVKSAHRIAQNAQRMAHRACNVQAVIF